MASEEGGLYSSQGLRGACIRGQRVGGPVLVTGEGGIPASLLGRVEMGRALEVLNLELT